MQEHAAREQAAGTRTALCGPPDAPTLQLMARAGSSAVHEAGLAAPVARGEPLRTAVSGGETPEIAYPNLKLSTFPTTLLRASITDSTLRIAVKLPSTFRWTFGHDGHSILIGRRLPSHAEKAVVKLCPRLYIKQKCFLRLLSPWPECSPSLKPSRVLGANVEVQVG